MSKQSGFMAKQQAITQMLIDSAERVTRQMMVDTLQITLHEEFGWGYDRIAKLDTLWQQNYHHFHGALNRKNPEADVLQAHLDRRLSDLIKDRQPLVPFAKRYPDIKPITYEKRR